jgi:hypothetical protein
MSDIALAETFRAVVQGLFALQSSSVTCVPHLSHSIANDVRLQELASLLEAHLRERTPSGATDEVWCAFCCKNAHEVRVMVQAPAAAICDECVIICESALRQRGSPWFSWRTFARSWRETVHRRHCDKIAAALVSIAGSLAGRGDADDRIRLMLDEAGITAGQALYLGHVLSAASDRVLRTSKQAIRCAFCGRSDRERIIKGIRAAICEVCVASASSTAVSEGRSDVRNAPSPPVSE